MADDGIEVLVGALLALLVTVLVFSLPGGILCMITDHPASVGYPFKLLVKTLLSTLGVTGDMEYWLFQLSIFVGSLILALAVTSTFFSGYIFLVPAVLYVNSVPCWMKVIA